MPTASTRHAVAALAVGAAVACLAPSAGATTRAVNFNSLTASASLSAPLLADDTLFVDSLVTTEVGALTQTVTFTLGAGVSSLGGFAAWEVTTAAGPGPRLVGVNIDILDAANNLIVSDSGVSVANGFATSSFASAIGPGTYRLVATGTAVRDASLDISVSFAAAVPEPGMLAMLLAGAGAVGLLARRRG